MDSPNYAPPPNQIHIVWICPMRHEVDAARGAFDETYHLDNSNDYKRRHRSDQDIDRNTYYFGKIAGFNVVLCLPGDSNTGPLASMAALTGLVHTFGENYQLLLVGIAGGMPKSDHDPDIRLGDVVIGVPKKGHSGVIDPDSGWRTKHSAVSIPTTPLKAPNERLLDCVQKVMAVHDNDTPSGQQQLQEAIEHVKTNLPTRTILPQDVSWDYPGKDTDNCFNSIYDCKSQDRRSRDSRASCPSHCDLSQVVQRPLRAERQHSIHAGAICSTSKVIMSANYRKETEDAIYEQHWRADILAFEMEGYSISQRRECLQVRGICDYADTHKNKLWQGYAALVAAAVARLIVQRLSVMLEEQTNRRENSGFGPPLTRRTTQLSKQSTLKTSSDSVLKTNIYDTEGLTEDPGEMVEIPARRAGTFPSRPKPTIADAGNSSNSTNVRSRTLPGETNTYTLPPLHPTETLNAQALLADIEGMPQLNLTSIPEIYRSYHEQAVEAVSKSKMCIFTLDIEGMQNEKSSTKGKQTITSIQRSTPTRYGPFDARCYCESPERPNHYPPTKLVNLVGHQESYMIRFWVPADDIIFIQRNQELEFSWMDCTPDTPLQAPRGSVYHEAKNSIHRRITLGISFENEQDNEIFKEAMLNTRSQVPGWIADDRQDDPKQDSQTVLSTDLSGNVMKIYKRNLQDKKDDQYLLIACCSLSDKGFKQQFYRIRVKFQLSLVLSEEIGDEKLTAQLTGLQRPFYEELSSPGLAASSTGKSRTSSVSEVKTATGSYRQGWCWSDSVQLKAKHQRSFALELTKHGLEGFLSRTLCWQMLEKIFKANIECQAGNVINAVVLSGQFDSQMYLLCYKLENNSTTWWIFEVNSPEGRNADRRGSKVTVRSMFWETQEIQLDHLASLPRGVEVDAKFTFDKSEDAIWFTDNVVRQR